MKSISGLGRNPTSTKITYITWCLSAGTLEAHTHWKIAMNQKIKPRFTMLRMPFSRRKRRTQVRINGLGLIKIGRSQTDAHNLALEKRVPPTVSLKLLMGKFIPCASMGLVPMDMIRITNQTYSSKYHQQWNANKGTFNLPGTYLSMVTLVNKGQCLPVQPSNTPTNNQVQINIAVQQVINQFKAETTK